MHRMVPSLNSHSYQRREHKVVLNGAKLPVVFEVLLWEKKREKLWEVVTARFFVKRVREAVGGGRVRGGNVAQLTKKADFSVISTRSNLKLDIMRCATFYSS